MRPPETDEERFRSEANECRQLVERTTSAIDNQTWLWLAEDWLSI
jgi:hypothetical protein